MMSYSKNDFTHLEEFFSLEEWVQISDYEKLRLSNIKENYEMMIKIGKTWAASSS